MSHSWTGKNGTEILYNPDLSEVILTNPMQSRLPHGHTVELDGEDLLEFVADYVRGEKVSQLEQMTTTQLFGLEDGQ